MRLAADSFCSWKQEKDDVVLVVTIRRFLFLSSSLQQIWCGSALLVRAIIFTPFITRKQPLANAEKTEAAATGSQIRLLRFDPRTQGISEGHLSYCDTKYSFSLLKLRGLTKSTKL